MKKFKLNAVLASILSLGTIISSSSASAVHGNVSESKMQTPVFLDESSVTPGESSVTPDVTEDDMDYTVPGSSSNEQHPALIDFPFWICFNGGDEINRLLESLKRGMLGEFKDIFKLPENAVNLAEEFMVNKNFLMLKFSYWQFITVEYGMKKERKMLNRILDMLADSLAEFEEESSRTQQN